MKLEFSRQIFEKYSNIKFHGNPSSGSRVVPCGRTNGQTDTTKLIIAFRNFANAPKKSSTGKLMLDPPLAHNQLKPSSTIAGLKPETQHTCFCCPQWNKNYNKSRPLCECTAGKAKRPRYQPRSVASWIPPRAYGRLSVIITFTLPAGWTHGYSTGTLAHPWLSKCFILNPVTPKQSMQGI